MSQRKKEAITPTDEMPTEAARAPLTLQPVPEVPELPASVVIEVPLGQLDQGYLMRHIDTHLKTPLQYESLRRLVNGLRQVGEKLDDGKPVASPADAMKWLLEQVGQHSRSSI